jgi:hypothetical protein
VRLAGSDASVRVPLAAAKLLEKKGLLAWGVMSGSEIVWRNELILITI